MFNRLSKKISLALLVSAMASTTFAQKGGSAASSATDEPISGTEQQGTKPDWKPSLVADGSYDKIKHYNEPIPWQYIREADVLWKKTVWREIDILEKQNIAFRYQGDENTGGGMFIEILFDAIKRGKITAYSSFDDRFTTKLTKEQLNTMLSPQADTIPQEDPVTGEIQKRVIFREFRPDEITSFSIKENWLFDRNQGKMVRRIVGLAPKKDVYGLENHDYRGKQTMFWLNYTEIRPVLAAYEVFNPNNEIARMTWDEFFEGNQFSSKITKVSNMLDSRYEDLFGNDKNGKMEALYEAQQDATEIFNKEHDMWVY